jgi:hypothetical protein
MKLNELIRCHLHARIDSFYLLTQHQKREFCIYALLSDEFDTYDLFMNHDGIKIHELLKQFFIDKKIEATQAIEKALDQIILYNSSSFDEIFDEEFERYLDESTDNCFIVRSENGAISQRATGV